MTFGWELMPYCHFHMLIMKTPLRNVASLTVFHVNTKFSLLHKLCTHVRFFIIFPESPEDSLVEQTIFIQEVDGPRESANNTLG